MMLYGPDGNAITSPIRWRPKTCFLMTKLGPQTPPTVQKIRERVTAIFKKNNIEVIDAKSVATGKDILDKIWRLIAAVPIGVAIEYPNMSRSTMSNILYEFGLMHAMGKEVLRVLAPKAIVPSDLSRTEYIRYDDEFDDQFPKFIDSLQERADYYDTMADQLNQDPLLAIDFYRRAYLLTANEEYRLKARALLKAAGLDKRAKGSVEMLVASFCLS